MESIPTPLARAPNPVKIAPPEYFREPQIRSRCPSLYLCVTGGRRKGRYALAVVFVIRNIPAGWPSMAQTSMGGMPKSINSASSIYSKA